MSYEAWPSPESRRGPLPRIEDLPIGEQGYDQEAVRKAFDAFYRHAAQLDASLRALEAVEVFRREATELRADLRSLRSLGFGGEPGWTPALYAHERPRRELPAAVPRVAAEAALLIAVAVVAGVGHFRSWIIGAAVGGAWLVVMLSEILAARARYRVPEPSYFGFATAETYAVEEELAVEEPVGWAALDAAEEDEVDDEPVDTPPEEQTMSGEEAEPVAEAQPDAEPEAELEPEPEAASPPRRRWFRRQAQEPEEAEEPVVEPSGNVRVVDGEPWEQGFDGDEAEEEAEPPNEEEAPEEPELAARGGLGRIRRRR